jgi:AcrR family transcriptional regulator
MRSTAGQPAAPADFTTRARIRDGAITVFGEHGFSAGVRAVAAAAGVSPGLVNHHFGSKDGLRAACDERILEIIRVEKARAITVPSAAGMIAALAEIEVYGPVVAYMLRSFQAGGSLARSLLEHMISDATENLERGVAAGTIRASRDPAARARYLTLLNVGGMLLYLQLRLDTEGKLDYRKAIRDLAEELTFPGVELYTEGMLTDSSMLDQLINTRKAP